MFSVAEIKMEFEFDKEIDALLRQTAKGEAVSAAEDSRFRIQDSKSNHLDADEISAFAENALPEKAKQRFTIHLADCDACRKKLSNIILLNAEAENETAPAKEIEIISPVIPWYKRLFAFPNLAYTLGALVIVFSGIIGFTVLQNVNNAGNAEVSQINDKPQNIQEMPADIAAETESFAGVANMAANSNAAATSLSTNKMMANSAAKNAPENSNMSPVVSQPVAAPPPPPKEEPQTGGNAPAARGNENSFVLDGTESNSVSEQKQNKVAEKDKKEKADEDAATDTSVSARKTENLPKGAVFDSQLKMAKKSASPKNEAATVGGKTFRRANDVWYDTAYSNQPTTNIARGSEEYKKLDKKLRAIAENLKGTLVVVWKEKAYRIQ